MAAAGLAEDDPQRLANKERLAEARKQRNTGRPASFQAKVATTELEKLEKKFKRFTDDSAQADLDIEEATKHLEELRGEKRKLEEDRAQAAEQVETKKAEQAAAQQLALQSIPPAARPAASDTPDVKRKKEQIRERNLALQAAMEELEKLQEEALTQCTLVPEQPPASSPETMQVDEEALQAEWLVNNGVPLPPTDPDKEEEWRNEARRSFETLLDRQRPALQDMSAKRARLEAGAGGENEQHA